MTTGAIIILDNTYQNTWEVIGVNHDNTTNTVDIMSRTNINSMKFSTSSQYYSGSALQTFCNETIPNAFTNATTKSLIKTMDVVSNNSTLTGQYGKALSCTEIGYTNSYAQIEGATYALSGYLYRSGVGEQIWTRTYKTLYSSNRPWCVGSSGTLSDDDYSHSNAVLPVLRF